MNRIKFAGLDDHLSAFTAHPGRGEVYAMQWNDAAPVWHGPQTLCHIGRSVCSSGWGHCWIQTGSTFPLTSATPPQAKYLIKKAS